jgi:hypothetical protein
VKTTSVCNVDKLGRIVKARSLATDPEVIAAWLGKTGLAFERVVHEAGPMSSEPERYEDFAHFLLQHRYSSAMELAIVDLPRISALGDAAAEIAPSEGRYPL